MHLILVHYGVVEVRGYLQFKRLSGLESQFAHCQTIATARHLEEQTHGGGGQTDVREFDSVRGVLQTLNIAPTHLCGIQRDLRTDRIERQHSLQRRLLGPSDVNSERHFKRSKFLRHQADLDDHGVAGLDHRDGGLGLKGAHGFGLLQLRHDFELGVHCGGHVGDGQVLLVGVADETVPEIQLP